MLISVDEEKHDVNKGFLGNGRPSLYRKRKKHSGHKHACPSAQFPSEQMKQGCHY
jgi:hypothetical protein